MNYDQIDSWKECTFWIGDAVVKRERTGDRRTLGLIVASEAKNRVNLRQKPSKSSKSLGKYYTCTQVEILSLKDGWYHVKVNGLDEGYIMKDYVMIVDQE